MTYDLDAANANNVRTVSKWFFLVTGDHADDASQSSTVRAVTVAIGDDPQTLQNAVKCE
jgi:hypothetical protein